MGNIKQLLAEARLPEKTVELCLRGDLAAEYEAVEAEYVRAVENRGNSLSAGVEVAELQERLAALRERVAAAGVTFRLRALRRPEYRKLVAEHPPRKDPETGEVDAKDNALEVNRDTFFEPLIRACTISPELDDEDWALLFEQLTDRQWDRLMLAAFTLNRGDVDVPFSLADSRPTPT